MSAPAPRDIATALLRLRAAGESLRRRPARETLELCARALDDWRDPGGELRRALEKELPSATGFSPEVVREGLARGLEPWSGEALLDQVETELGGADALDGRGRLLARGFDVTAVVLAGAIPLPTLLDLLAPLVLRSPVLAKPGLHDPVTARLAAARLAALDPGLGRCVEVAAFRREDEDCTAALLEADCVLASGSDETVAELAAAVRPAQRFVGHGHRLSLAALGPAALGAAELAGAARRIALDTALWDQLGCLSPTAVWCVGGADEAARLGKALAEALADAEARWPRGRVPPEAALRAEHERAFAEMRGRPLEVDSQARWTVVCEADAGPRPAPLYRFLRVHPAARLEDLIEGIRPLGPHLACAALDGFGSLTTPLARALGDLGASRICRTGEMQAPPLGWRRDNRGLLEPLARFSDLG